jgi:hypothetical protein
MLQGLLVAHELRERLLPAEVYSVRPTVLKVLEALTGSAAKEIMDCERFEFLGDCVLKFAVAQDLYQQSGAIRADHTLGFEQDRCVSNGSLFRAAHVCSCAVLIKATVSGRCVLADGLIHKTSRTGPGLSLMGVLCCVLAFIMHIQY